MEKCKRNFIWTGGLFFTRSFSQHTPRQSCDFGTKLHRKPRPRHYSMIRQPSHQSGWFWRVLDDLGTSMPVRGRRWATSWEAIALQPFSYVRYVIRRVMWNLSFAQKANSRAFSVDFQSPQGKSVRPVTFCPLIIWTLLVRVWWPYEGGFHGVQIIGTIPRTRSRPWSHLIESPLELSTPLDCCWVLDICGLSTAHLLISLVVVVV